MKASVTSEVFIPKYFHFPFSILSKRDVMYYQLSPPKNGAREATRDEIESKVPFVLFFFPTFAVVLVSHGFKKERIFTMLTDTALKYKEKHYYK